MSPGEPRVVVVGGGLAGITAAIALAESGARVTLLEARPRLGGATCSFTRDGLTVDTGQHIFLGCCSAYRGLLGKLGMTAHAPLQDRFDVTVLAPGPAGRTRTPRQARLRRTALPGPLHMLPALGRYPFLTRAERARVALPALAMRRVDPADPEVDAQRFGDWLAARGQSERARRALWDLFTVSALNIAGDDASLALAATVVKTGLLGKNNAADIGVPALPLGELHGDAAAALLTRLGAQVALSTKVAAIEVIGSGATGSGATGSGATGGREDSGARFRVRLARPADDASLGAEIAADAVVLAVPHFKAAPLVPPDALPSGTVAAWSGLGASPIVNVHVIYDRPVMSLPFAAAIDSPVQWVFDRTSISGLGDGRSGGPQYLAISLSAADEYAEVPAARLQEQFVPALAELFPAARDARVTEFFVTRERRATFRQVPGSGALRPKAGTQLPGLVLAGAWTDTGWPDTMEGAVRSGLSAAIELRQTLLASGSAALGSGSAALGSGSATEPAQGTAEPAGPFEPNASASTIGVRQ
jgi:squalene-associated FAD-dependent desaturase